MRGMRVINGSLVIILINLENSMVCCSANVLLLYLAQIRRKIFEEWRGNRHGKR